MQVDRLVADKAEDTAIELTRKADAAAPLFAPTMLADSGHVACSTVYEAWIRLRDLVNLYLACGRVPGPWPSRLRPPGYGPKTERWKHLSIDQSVLCRL